MPIARTACCLAARRRGRSGLLFLDGHADFFQPSAEPKGEVASMELAIAVGRGPAVLADLEGRRPLVREEDVVAFGYRDAEAAAAEGLELEDLVARIPVGPQGADDFALVWWPESGDPVTAIVRGDAVIDLASPGGARRFDSRGITPWHLAEFTAVTRLRIAGSSSSPRPSLSSRRSASGHSGTGSIGIFVSRQAKKVIGIELIKEAIDDARENAAANAVNNATFFAGDVIDICDNAFFAEHGAPDVIITDPPRAGMHEKLTAKLLEVAAPRIVYVSCNPATQARDLALLNEKYAIEKVQPVDMFPHTHHIENVVLLKKRY